MRLLRSLSFCLFGFCAGAGAETTTLDLPDIGDSTGSILSPEFERRLGQAFLNHVRQQADITSDPEVESYVQSLGYRLVSHSDNNTQLFTFFVIDDPLINAFAAPGGIVGINSGTIINSDTESELAGVVAHEVSHVTQKHMARSAEMSSKLSLPMMAAMLGAILVATQNPEAGQAAIIAIQGGMVQAQINFTRHNEEEADRVGIQLLERSGFDPLGMPGFFEKLHRNSRYFAQAPEFLRSHPLTKNRIAESQARAEAYPRKEHYDESRSFYFIRAKLMVKSYRNPQEAIGYFRNELERNEGIDPTGVLNYGLALAQAEAGDYGAARGLLENLLARDPENPALLLASADVAARQGQFDDAFRYYERTEHLYPDYRPLVLNYSEALLQHGQPQKARDLLKQYGKNNDPDLTYYDFLTRAEAESGNNVESGIANAEYYYLSGETRVAIERLKYVMQQKNPPPDYYQQERIMARLAFLEQELQIEKDLKLTK
ncbi:MAG: M48 family metallopeptidase [Gammaproteobacteria bacterium]|nr:M48 family metallopeptidase [Gammaproteobacteria bacterium]